MRTTPILLGIAGDSGSGKDTFTKLLMSVFGESNTTVVAGDDYHRWPRGHEMWNVLTHLNVNGNRLYEQQEHAVALLQGDSIYKAVYNHGTGQFTEKQSVAPNHVMIFQGLHSLSTPELRRIYDLKVFLDPEEDLRHFWKLRRDCGERGHDPEQVLKTLAERTEDRKRYIIPQREQADVVVRWTQSTPLSIPEMNSDPELTLEIIALNSFDLTRVLDVLKNEPGIFVEHHPYVDADQQTLRIRGKIPSLKLHEIKDLIMADDPWFKLNPRLTADLAGCLQLILLLCLRDKLRWNGQLIWLD
jgi:uridine kinase